MRIEWVNHASFIIHTGSTRLITDPWIEGTAFNNGWRLMSPTKFQYEDFSRITHIWVSHEHPDHFSPPNLKRIPEQYRKRIRFLFHQTKDKRVIKLCRTMGFSIQELPPEEWVDLGDGVRIICGPQGLVDSWMAVSAEGKLLLNMNDCVFPQGASLEKINRLVRAAGPIDVLLSQFSYANWVGNPKEHATHRRHAERKLGQIRRQVEIFKPANFIPFASFVIFSHRENFFMNEAINRIGDVYRFASEDVKVPTQVMYPGDAWTVAEPRLSGAAIAEYERDYVQALTREPDTSGKVPFEKLKEIAVSFLRKCSAKNNRTLLNAIPASVARLTDLGIDVQLSFRKGLVLSRNGTPDIVTSSDSLAYCMATDWGGDTLAINGRYEVPKGGKIDRFFRIFRVPAHNSAGDRFDFPFLMQQAKSKLLKISE